MTATLKRKLAEAQQDTQARGMTSLRALRLSFARAGNDLFDLPLAVMRARHQRALPDAMEDAFVDGHLLLLLECAGGQTGAASVSSGLVSALIQMQTMGAVSDRASTERAYTDTDAAMCAPLLEGVFSRAHDLSGTEPDKTLFDKVRFGARCEDARSLLLGLRAPRYRVFRITLDIALGKHQAEISIALPDGDAAAQSQGITPQADAEQAGQSPMLSVPTELRAVLARFHLSLSELNGLQPGDALPLRRDRLDDTALVAVSGQVIARGRLGQMNGNRAVRLMASPSVPQASPRPDPSDFDPLGSGDADVPAHTEAEADPLLPAGEDMPHWPGSEVADEEVALDGLSADQAAAQISELAGLSMDDLATPGPGPDVGSDISTAEFGGAAPLALDLDLDTPKPASDG